MLPFAQFLRQAQILILKIRDCIPPVKIFAFLELEPQLNIKTNLTGQAKLNVFQRSHFMQLIILTIQNREELK